MGQAAYIRAPSAFAPCQGAGARGAFVFKEQNWQQMDWKWIYGRVLDIFKEPHEVWPRLAGDGLDGEQVFKDFALPLILLGSLVSLLGMSLLGQEVSGLEIFYTALVSFGAPLASFLASSWVLAATAEQFGGRASLDRAKKCVAYSSAGGYVGSLVGNLHLSFFIFGLAGSVFSIFLLHQSLGAMAGVPPERRTGLTLLLVATQFIASLVVFVSVGYLYQASAQA